jgi:uncharacterized membrane protein
MLAAGLLLFLEALSAFVRRRTPEETSTEPLRAATKNLMRAVMLGTAVVLAFLAVDLPLGPTLPAVVVALMSLAILAAVVAPAIARLSAALREIRQSGHADKVEGYHVLYYSNVNDPRLWVPKLGGIGMTINFAHRWAWPMMLLLLGAPIALAAVSLLSVR